MANPLVLLETLNKAIKAEQRNGCTNAGALGGFANFLLLSVDKLTLHPQAGLIRYRVILDRLKDLAQNYLELPPRQRQKSLEEIDKLVSALQQGLGAGPSHLSLVPSDGKLRDFDDRFTQGPPGKPTGSKVEPGQTLAAKFALTRPQQKMLLNGLKRWQEDVEKAKEWEKKDDPGGSRPGQINGKRGKTPEAGDRAKTLPVQYLRNVGPQRAKLLAKLGIVTVEDLLNHFPRRYEDRRQVKSISEVVHGAVETVRGRVTGHQELKPRRGLTIIKIAIRDATGTLNAVWFNNHYLVKQLPRGTEVIVTGKVDRRFGLADLAVTDYEVVEGGEFTPGIVPVYAATENLPPKQIRTLVGNALEHLKDLMPEILPETMLKRYGLMGRTEAYRQIHFPRDFKEQQAARRRLVFEEFLLLQLGIQRLRGKKAEVPGIPMLCEDSLLPKLRAGLPFKLTLAQERVIGEILLDMAGKHPMARLVQGDVGSGKTVVAAMALLRAVECGYQGAMMAPTEILAEQHFAYLKDELEPLGAKVSLLTGSSGKREREEILQQVAAGECDVLVGTHALIQEGVAFKALGLAVTDEQHRFGVRQRAELQQKGNNPHVLVMTATPIPRTLALTLYGDLHLSVIDEMPPGRKEIKTLHISDKSREKLYMFMEREIVGGRQVYVVCPLVEESEALDLRAATDLAEEMARRFPRYRIGLLHGRMKPQEKETVIEGFRANKIQVLVSTTVIEVGVNVPNASLMVVEGAERFGLAQLHQLRGRVGRGEYQSYCLLVSNVFSEDIQRRLGIMCETNDGFKIAEEDLKLRGPGEFFGTRQHGLPELKIADILQDGLLLEQARVAAEIIMASPANALLLREMEKRFGPELFLGGSTHN